LTSFSLLVTGKVSTLAGITAGGSGDGQGTVARINGPNDVAVSSWGDIFVVEYYNHLVRQVTSSGSVSTLAGLPGVAGSTDGTKVFAKFNSPYGVSVSTKGTIFVAEYGNQLIRQVTTSGKDFTCLCPSSRPSHNGALMGNRNSVYFCWVYQQWLRGWRKQPCAVSRPRSCSGELVGRSVCCRARQPHDSTSLG
jgi:hypothetical protein